jgi:hypothetical protein
MAMRSARGGAWAGLHRYVRLPRVGIGPHHANPDTGQIIRFGSRGVYTFHTKGQVLALSILGGAALAFFIAGSALGWPFSDGTYDKARATYENNGDSGDEV